MSDDDGRYCSRCLRPLSDTVDACAYGHALELVTIGHSERIRRMATAVRGYQRPSSKKIEAAIARAEEIRVQWRDFVMVPGRKNGQRNAAGLERERHIVQMIAEGFTLRLIAVVHDISIERVRQLRASARQVTP